MAMPAKYAGTCKACGRGFAAGTSIDWTKATGSRHAVCPTSAAPATANVDTTAAPFEIAERWEPCKRTFLDQQIASILGETRSYPKRGPVLRGAAGADRKPVPGVYVVVGSGPCHYQNAQDNEDMGDMSGAHWTVTLYLRAATPEEAAIAQARADHQKLAEAIPEIFTALDGMIERGARAEMAAAAERPDYARHAFDHCGAFGEHVAEVLRTAPRLWSDGKGSYVKRFELNGAVWFASYQYVYDFDQPIFVVGPRAAVEHAAVAQSIVGWGWALQSIARRMDREAAKAAELGARKVA